MPTRFQLARSLTMKGFLRVNCKIRLTTMKQDYDNTVST